MSGNTDSLRAAYDAASYRRLANAIAEKLADHLRHTRSGGGPVLPSHDPAALMAGLPQSVPAAGGGDAAALAALDDVIARSNHLQHPRFIGHQVSAPLPLAALTAHVMALLNNSAAIFEMAPYAPAIEKILIGWIAGMAGFPHSFGGVFVGGGSIGNLTALLAARQAKLPGNVWDDGLGALSPRPAILVSEQAHYCVRRAAGIMGLGADAAVGVPADGAFRMDIGALSYAYEDARRRGFAPFAVVASAGTTATGSFDPLGGIADFCAENNLWLHIDGAHGFAVNLSPDLKHLTRGIERADSFVWDLHKMMLMPALLTAVVFRRGADAYGAFAQQASYLFRDGDEEPWFDLAQRTIECTKPNLALTAWICLLAFGSDFFRDYVQRCAELTGHFARRIEAADDFALATRPDFNIICFRHEPADLSGDALEEHQLAVRERIVRSGAFYIVRTKLNDRWYLRCTVINPLTTEADIDALIAAVRGKN